MKYNFIEDVKKQLQEYSINISSEELNLVYISIVKVIQKNLKSKGRILLPKIGTLFVYIPKKKFFTTKGIQKIHKNPDFIAERKVKVKFISSLNLQNLMKEIKEDVRDAT